MAKVPVLFVEPERQASGLVTEGTSGDQEQGLVTKAAAKIAKVADMDATQIAVGVVAIAEKVGPELSKAVKKLGSGKLKEVSIGCAIQLNGGVVVAGVGAEASVTITFDLS